MAASYQVSAKVLNQRLQEFKTNGYVVSEWKGVEPFAYDRKREIAKKVRKGFFLSWLKR